MALSSKECDPVDRMALKKTETQMEQSQADFTLSWNRKSKLLAWVVVNPRARASASLGVGGGGGSSVPSTGHMRNVRQAAHLMP